MKVLDLFSGIGGFSLGLQRAGMKTVAFVEIDPFCRKVLNKHWPDVPCYEDIRDVTAARLVSDGIPTPDIITGGFPCQPFSTAGKRRGKEDDRHLWPEMFRLIQECSPNYIIGENVAGFINLGLDDVLSDLESIGYTARAIAIPACGVGCNQRRERVWILAYSMQREREMGWDTTRSGWKSKQIPWYEMGKEKATPRVVGEFDGIPEGLDRIKSLGNSVTPSIPEIIGRAINGQLTN